MKWWHIVLIAAVTVFVVNKVGLGQTVMPQS